MTYPEISSASVFGLGKLGLPLAAMLASVGYRTTGVDVDEKLVGSVNAGENPHYEPGLTELLAEAKVNLVAGTDFSGAVTDSDISFIIVPTPSLAEGSFSLEYIKKCLQAMAPGLKSKQSRHLLVITSTVLPGDCQNVLIPLIEELTGMSCPADYGFCYSPEFIALGSVIRDFTHPDVVLIGESDVASGDALSGIYAKVCRNSPPISRMNIPNAELAKISLNAYVTMKITFANILAEIAEKLPGGNVDDICGMIGSDSRIGSKYLRGGVAYGGPCFPRDNKAFYSVAERLGGQSRLAMTTDAVNTEQANRLAVIIERKLGSVTGKEIAILGATYKPDTDVVEESASLKVAGALLEKGARIRLYDPAGLENARRVLGEAGVHYAASALDSLKGAHLCFLATPWDEFRRLDAADFLDNMKIPVLLDGWRMFERPEFRTGLDYMPLGRNLE